MRNKPLQLDGQVIEYEIQHRPRVTRRIHLETNEAGNLRVIAPRRMSRRAVHQILQQRAPHVARFIASARVKQAELPRHRYASGENHLYLGTNYPLEVVVHSGKRGSVQISAGTIQLVTPDAQPETVKKKLSRWYRQQAQQHFDARLAAISHCAPWTGDQAPPLRLRKMKRTWGSCSVKGLITLNPHLVKAPAKCVDYVIAHEICHLRELNHGKAFYTLQQQLFPDWRQIREQLQARAHIYLFEE